MGLLGNLLSATVKVALSPVTVASDVLTTLSGEESNLTAKTLKSAVEDIDEGIDELSEGRLL